MSWTTLGTTYLLHFDRPYQHARHYAGFARDLDKRLKLHRTGQSNCKLMRAVYEAGIGFKVARIWPNTTYAFERRVHGLVLSHICPMCNTHPAAMKRARPRLSDYQDPAPVTTPVEDSWQEQTSDTEMVSELDSDLPF